MSVTDSSRIQTTVRVALVLIGEAFRVLLVGYFVLLVLDQIWPGFASYQINMNWWLAAVVVAGLPLIFGEPKMDTSATSPAEKKSRFTNVALIAVSLIGAGIVYSRLPDSGSLQIISPILSAIFIYTLGKLLSSDK